MWLQCPSIMTTLPVLCAYHSHVAEWQGCAPRKIAMKIKTWGEFNFTKIGKRYRNKSLTTRHMHKSCIGTYHACFSSQQSYSVCIKAIAAMCKCPTTNGNVQNTETWLKLRFCFRLVQQNKQCNSRTQFEAEGWIKCCNKAVFNGQSLFQCTSPQIEIKFEDFIFYVYLNKKKAYTSRSCFMPGLRKSRTKFPFKNVFPSG